MQTAPKTKQKSQNGNLEKVFIKNQTSVASSHKASDAQSRAGLCVCRNQGSGGRRGPSAPPKAAEPRSAHRRNRGHVVPPALSPAAPPDPGIPQLRQPAAPQVLCYGFSQLPGAHRRPGRTRSRAKGDTASPRAALEHRSAHTNTRPAGAPLNAPPAPEDLQ